MMNASNTAIAGAAQVVMQPDAAEYCDAHALVDLVALRAQIASHHFMLAGPIEVELETDPDSDEQRPILNLSVCGDLDLVQEQYRAYVAEWVRRVSPDRSLLIGTFINMFC
ncbi:MAG TPA: hypothetical protein VFE47_27955 [Tepidisphaeraceae bacterium]|jgi:hypothetical protein|nr:hypothetical protein [Tepidisphaeraceae bacterium]